MSKLTEKNKSIENSSIQQDTVNECIREVEELERQLETLKKMESERYKSAIETFGILPPSERKEQG